MQDPENREVVYAGTTEGLYKTANAGRTFERMTDPDVVVNDVYVDPTDSNHVLLATDRGGVLASQDAGVTFAASNQGISERKVAALLVDRNDPDRFYAGVVNDKNYGGVFRSNDAARTGSSWAPGWTAATCSRSRKAKTARSWREPGMASSFWILPAQSDPPPVSGGSSTG